MLHDEVYAVWDPDLGRLVFHQYVLSPLYRSARLGILALVY